MRVTAAQKQELRLALDVTDYDELGLELLVYEGTSVAAQIISGMQMESEAGWSLVGSTFTATRANGSTKANFKNFLRYIRWEITSAGNATFEILGMARRWHWAVAMPTQPLDRVEPSSPPACRAQVP